MTPEDLTTCKEYCIDKTKNLHSIWVDYTAMWDDVAKGNVWVAYSWPDTYVALKDTTPVEYVRPKEGTLSWAEALVLRADSENYFHAHEYADAWSSVPTGERLLTTWGYGHSNLNVDLSIMDPEVVAAFGLEDPIESLSEPNSLIDRYQPQRAAYNRAWDEVKAAAG
jgi:spermidine/putrescine-binding protein